MSNKPQIEGATKGATSFFVNPNRVTIIGLDTEHKEGDHPLWDERIKLPVDAMLAKNIRRYGVRESVKLRKNGVHESGPYKGEDVLEVVDGRSRTRACRKAFEEATEAGEVPPELKVELDHDDEDTTVGVMISLNELRRDDSAVIKASKAARLVTMGKSEEEIATMFGVSVRSIKNWLVVNDLSRGVKKAIERGEISAHAAVQFKDMENAEQEEQLDKILAEHKAAPAPANGKKKKKVTAKAVKRKAKNGHGVPILTKRILNQLVEDKDFLSGLSADCRAIIQILALGDQAAVKRVKGLSKWLSAD